MVMIQFTVGSVVILDVIGLVEMLWASARYECVQLTFLCFVCIE